MKKKIFYTTEKLTSGGPPRRTAGVASPSEWPELKRYLRRNGLRIKSWHLIENDQTWVIDNRPSLHMSPRPPLIARNRDEIATQPASSGNSTKPAPR